MSDDYLEPNEREMHETIVRMLMTLPWDRRAEVCKSLRYNSTFCFHCGMEGCGGVCQNDE